MIYCHKRIPIEGQEKAESYCMLERGHEDKGIPCEKLSAKKIDHRTFREQARAIFENGLQLKDARFAVTLINNTAKETSNTSQVNRSMLHQTVSEKSTQK